MLNAEICQDCASPATKAKSNRPSPYKSKPCLECGEVFAPHRPDETFCTPKCRKDWGNRRMQRGAQLYDLMMAQRYERSDATEAGTWTMLTRMTQQFKAEDEAARAGRRSWRAIKDVISSNLYLKAIVSKIRAGR